jgi:hypothetical protein
MAFRSSWWVASCADHSLITRCKSFCRSVIVFDVRDGMGHCACVMLLRLCVSRALESRVASPSACAFMWYVLDVCALSVLVPMF